MVRYHESDFANDRAEKSFLKRLHQTIAWCARRPPNSDTSKSLRFLSEHTRWGVLADRLDNVASVANACERELRRLGYEDRSDRSPTLAGGRLLAYFPDLELFDGCAESYSEGFYDINNAPPCDTWVAMCDGAVERSNEDFLISWVPPDCLAAARIGIEVNPEECILWLADVEHPIVPALKSRGLA